MRAFSLRNLLVPFCQNLQVNPSSPSDKPLPQSAEAERAVLAAILLDSPGIQEVMSRLEPTDFFLPANRAIYEHMQRLVAEGKSPDEVLVVDALISAGVIETVGGPGYVSRIPDGMPRVSNLCFYVDLLKRKAQLRQRAYTAEAILEMALGSHGNPEEVLKQIEMLSAQLRNEVGQKRVLNFRSGVEISMAIKQGIEWIVPGFVVRGGITELGAKVKAGKTTLIMQLVRAAAEGLDFLGRSTLKTTTVYLTEQPIVSFQQAMERANLLGRDDFHVLFHNETRGTPWPEVARAAVAECRRVGALLLVVDTLPQFAGLRGDSENNSGDALAAMEPLLRAAADGIGVIVARHERKSGGDVGDSGRGSSAFAGAVDIVLSLRKPPGSSRRTQRVLQALSRFSDTPPELLIELTETGYVALGDPQDAVLREAKNLITAVAPRSEAEAMTLKEIADASEVPRTTAQRAVEGLLREDVLDKVGDGKRNSPYRYLAAENLLCPTSNVNGQKEKSRAAAAGKQ